MTLQLQQREAGSLLWRILTSAILLIGCSLVPPNSDAHPISRQFVTIQWHPQHRQIKWESVGFLDGYYMVGIATILYPGFKLIINIISKKDNSYHNTYHNGGYIALHIHGPHENVISNFGKVSIRIMHFDFCARWATCSFMLIHLLTTRSCNFLDLLVLRTVSSVMSVVFNLMLANVRK